MYVNVLNFFFLLQPSWEIADPICTFVFSVIVLGTTLAILKDAIIVLMEGKSYNTITCIMHNYPIRGVATKCHFQANGKREVQLTFRQIRKGSAKIK